MAHSMTRIEPGSASPGGATQRALVTFYRHGLRVAELWLDEPAPLHQASCDVLLLRQYKAAPERAFSSPFVSLAIDLSQSAESLLQGLSSGTKYEVRRAEGKDQVLCVNEPAVEEEVCLQFQRFYDEFALSKGVPLLSIRELLARARAGALRMSRAVYAGETVVWHVHAASTKQVTLLYSASHFRQLDDNETRAAIGRANRLLHWKDMLHFKGMGFEVYDFGGWYAGEEDQARLKINKFKEGFGGLRVEQVNAALALTLRGWVYLRMRQLLSLEQRMYLLHKIQTLLRR
jgi:hypothetical protein